MTERSHRAHGESHRPLGPAGPEQHRPAIGSGRPLQQLAPAPSAPFIHREEVKAIWAVATAPQEGSLLIAGGPGAGKTVLLGAVGAIPGVVIFRLRINPAEAGLPLSGLSAIVASFQSPDAAALSAKLLSPPDAPAQMSARAAEVLALIHELPAPSTLLLIDDVDQMDDASQAVLAMVATRLGGTGLRLVGTVSVEPPTGSLAALPRLKLAPLDFGDSLELVTSLTGPNANEAVRRMVVTASSGNPRALSHMAGVLTGEQLAGAAAILFPIRVPRVRSVRATDRPGSSSAEQQALLARLSCAHFSSREAIVRESGSFRVALEDLLSDGSVVCEGRYLRIADAAVRSRVYWGLDAATRLEVHTLASHAESGEPGLAAWHRSWADAEGISPGELFAAATAFTRRGLIWQAVELAERALALTPIASQDAAGLFELARAMFLRGELAYAARYARLGQRSPDAATIAPRLAILRTRIEFTATQELLTTEFDEGVAVQGPAESDEAAYALAVIAQCHAERWEVDSARESLARARRLLDAASAETIELYELSLMFLAALEGDPAPAIKMLERLSRRGWAEGASAQALLLLGRSLTYVDRYVEARRLFRAIIDLEPPPDPILLETARYYLAENEILAGNQFEAVAIINQLHAAGPVAQAHRNLHLLLVAWNWQASGNREEAAAAIGECNRRYAASGNPALSARLASYQGDYALMEGRFEDAIAFLRNAASIGAGVRNPSLLRYESDLIEAYVLAGRPGEAEAQLREFRSRAARYHTRWTTLALARAEALVAPGDASLGAFQQALALWLPTDSQFELGRTLLSYADRLVSLGHTQASTEQYLAARMIFTQLGAMQWARKADPMRLAHDHVPEHPLLAKLAPDERRVAELVRQGLRNKEIAAELFVSLRTVEVRLTRTYHKLGARSRSHLTSMLSSPGMLSGPDEDAANRAADRTR